MHAPTTDIPKVSSSGLQRAGTIPDSWLHPRIQPQVWLRQQSIQMFMYKLPTATHGASPAQQGQWKLEGIYFPKNKIKLHGV